MIEWGKKYCEWKEPWHKQEETFFVVNINSIGKMVGKLSWKGAV